MFCQMFKRVTWHGTHINRVYPNVLYTVITQNCRFLVKGSLISKGFTIYYKDSPVSAVSISAVPGLGRFTNSTKCEHSPI